MIAVVDPDAQVRRSCEFLLDGLDVETLSFESAEAMLDNCRDLELAALVTEISLPRMSGLELLSEARRVFGSELPVLVLTHQGDVRTAVSALTAGATDFLEKNEIGPPLAHRVRELLEQRGSRAPDREIGARSSRGDDQSDRSRR